MKKILPILFVVLFIAGCNPEKKVENNTLTQVSTIDALLAGYYDGVMPLKQLNEYGDFGIGTFNKLDGEMIVLNGAIYQFKADGKIYNADLDNTTPFATVVNFKSSFYVPVKRDISISDFEAVIDSSIPNRNLFYAIKVTGDFPYIKTRSVPAQEKPYKALSEVTKTQAVFEKENQYGTLVGFLVPAYANGINVSGYHLHFISSDKSFGGHVLDFKTGNVKVEIDEINIFKMILPENSDFGKVDLSKDRSSELQKVEK